MGCFAFCLVVSFLWFFLVSSWFDFLGWFEFFFSFFYFLVFFLEREEMEKRGKKVGGNIVHDYFFFQSLSSEFPGSFIMKGFYFFYLW